MWPVPLFIGIYLAPESPWWLVRKGRTEEAKRSLLRLTSLNKETDFDADETIAMMVHTTALEEKVSPSSKTFPAFLGHLLTLIFRLLKELPIGTASRVMTDVGQR